MDGTRAGDRYYTACDSGWRGFSIKCFFEKRTQVKNAHVFRHELVMEKQVWVRSTKRTQIQGGKAR